MIHHYDILARVETRHTYFKDGLLSSATWIPTSHTRQTLKNLGLNYKVANGTLKILASVEEQEDGSIRLDERLSDPFQLSFLIQFNQPYWSNFTTASAKGNTLFCFYNRPEEADTGLLHKTEHATSDDLLLKVGQAGYPLKDFVADGMQVQQVGEDTNVAEYATQKINEALLLHTKLLDEGLYTITDSQNKSESIFINCDKIQAQAICYLIFDKKRGDTIQEDLTWKTPTFKIHFDSLENHWRYYFPMEKISEHQGVRVLNGVREEVFDEGQTVEVSGRSMLRFTSLSPIKMIHHGDQTFQLKRNVGVSNRSEAVIVDRLPQPETQDLFRLDSEGNRYSDIYINL